MRKLPEHTVPHTSELDSNRERHALGLERVAQNIRNNPHKRLLLLDGGVYYNIPLDGP